MRLAAAVVAGSSVVAGVGAIGSVAAAPAGAQTTSGSGASAACPTGSGGTVAFHGTLTNGAAALGRAAKVSGLNGTLCGLVNLGTLTATIQPANFAFAPANTVLFGFLPLPTTLTVLKRASATLTMGAASGTFDTSMPVTLVASARILGLFTCDVGPFTPTFTTGTSGAVSGSALTGSLLTHLSGTLAAGTFAIPAITPSAGCPSFIAGLADLIMGLPLAPGHSTITSGVTLTPVLPGSGSSGSGSSGTGRTGSGHRDSGTGQGSGGGFLFGIF